MLVGLGAGVVASALVPGVDEMGIGTTTLLGVVGAFVGGSLGWVLFGAGFDRGALQPAAVLGAAAGAALLLGAWHLFTSRHPARR